MTNDLPGVAVQKMAALESWLAPIFAKFPHLPEKGRQTLLSIVPWLALVFGIVGLLGILSAGMLGMVVSVVSSGFVGQGVAPLILAVALLASAVACVLSILAFRSLQTKSRRGWKLLFYGTVLTTCSTILDLLFGYGTVGSLLGALVGFWLLFEVRGMYR